MKKRGKKAPFSIYFFNQKTLKNNEKVRKMNKNPTFDFKKLKIFIFEI